MNTFTSIADVWTYLNGLPKFQVQGASAAKFGLQNITESCRRLGNPHLKYPTIHVAGTNGKGTTCYLLEHVYNHAGYKTGLFTSPHLMRYNERVRINKQEINDDELLEFFREHEPLLTELSLSYFEISTVLAFWFFAKHEVDVAIIETGLGGRLDSTNIVQSSLAIITSIGLDHQEVLGETEAQIALEKAGIIKQNKPVILGNISPANAQVIVKVAGEKQSKIISSEQYNPKWERGVFKSKVLDVEIQTNLIESVNKWNVLTVLLATRELQNLFPVSQKDVQEAIYLFLGAPARFEKLLPNREWYFSGAHNQQALASIIDSLADINGKNPVLIFSMMKDKVSMESTKLLVTFRQRYFFQQEGERAATIELIRSKMAVESITEENYQTILKELETELVIIAGSFYFYPIVKRWMNKLKQ